MPWWTWVSLAFFAAIVLPASVVALLALRSLSRLQTVADRLQAAFEDLSTKSEELERRAARASSRVESVEAHFEHLRASLDRFSVLTWAIGDMTKTVSRLRSALLVHK
jgi:predicted RNase H-like nuclease (RuvC/YqgF family)